MEIKKTNSTIYYKSSRIIKGLLLFSSLFCYSALADNKVVVIPLAADAAAPGIAEFSGGDQNIALTAPPQVIRSVTIIAPANGTVIVNASGYMGNITAATELRCTITTGTGVNYDYLIYAGGTSEASTFLPFGATRGFSVTQGEHTYNLVCEVGFGAARIKDSNLTAMYFPN